MLWLESEGTLTEDQKQFGPKLRASPFVPSRRAVISVPGFYKTKLGSSSKSGFHGADSRAESEKVNHEPQVTAHGLVAMHRIENPRDAMSEQLIDEAVILDSPKVMHTARKHKEAVINASLSTPQFSSNHNTENQGPVFLAEEFDERLNKIDSEMGKFDNTKCMTQPRNISQDTLSESHEKQELVKPQTTQRTWTRLERKNNREKTQEHVANIEGRTAGVISGENRLWSEIDSNSELPCKKK